MPVMKHADAEIHYEEFGTGFPVLTFAPGALRSQIAYWQRSPAKPDQLPPWMDPTADLADCFRVIAMDQRNAGRSRAPLRVLDDWQVYADDHIALLDHLRIERCHTIGGCIGASFCLSLCERVPERIASTVLLQPIGRTAENIALMKQEGQSRNRRAGLARIR
jgi:pimeloyl-ACP methyl ester carboxylesterase